jgi:hypothetical protein
MKVKVEVEKMERGKEIRQRKKEYNWKAARERNS